MKSVRKYFSVGACIVRKPCESDDWFLFGAWCEFLLRDVSEHILVSVTYLLITAIIKVSCGRRGGVQFL